MSSPPIGQRLHYLINQIYWDAIEPEMNLLTTNQKNDICAIVKEQSRLLIEKLQECK